MEAAACAVPVRMTEKPVSAAKEAASMKPFANFAAVKASLAMDAVVIVFAASPATVARWRLNEPTTRPTALTPPAVPALSDTAKSDPAE